MCPYLGLKQLDPGVSPLWMNFPFKRGLKKGFEGITDTFLFRKHEQLFNE